MSRSKPNILITGTPGTGKTTTSEMVAQELGFQHINIGDWVREKSLHSGWNAEFECYDLDEDKVRRLPPPLSCPNSVRPRTAPEHARMQSSYQAPGAECSA